MRTFKWAAAIALTLVAATLGTGCVTLGRGERMDNDIAGLRSDVDTLRSSSDSDRQKLTEMLARATANLEELERVSKEASDRLARNGADLGAELIEVKDGINKLNGELGVVKRDMSKLQKDYDLFRNDVDSRLGSAEAAQALPNDPDALYAEANRRYQSADYEGAITAFERFASTFKKDKRADNAQFFAGESYLKQRKYSEAMFAYKDVLEKYSRSDVLDEATFGIGEALLGQKRPCDAKFFFADAIDKTRKKSVKKNARRRIKTITKSKKCK